MSQSLAEQCQTAFFEIVQRHENAEPLKEASLEARLGDWTEALTKVVVATCEFLGWKVSARGHLLELLPVPRSEYLGLDVVAFSEGDRRWHFPVTVVELENSMNDDRIAYSLWKILCVNAKLCIVFCYRRSSLEGSRLIQFLRDDVVCGMGVGDRMTLGGEILVVVGSRDDAATFPYGFFKWWELESNTGTFRLI
jgi:hypothetical protein